MLIHNMVNAGAALCVPGNHDVKLVRKLKGKDVQITHGLRETMQDLMRFPVLHGTLLWHEHKI